jgi:class 3 adenylate cyclase
MATKILVVDDEEDLGLLFRQRFRKRIRAGELDLSFATNGKAALEVLAADPEIHIVLTDINMPEMDGLTLLGRLRDVDRTLEVVIITAYGDMKNIRVAMNRGAFDFLVKPLDFDDLDATIEKTAQQVDRIEEGIEAARKAAVLEERNRFVRETFGRYVAEGVVDHLLDSPEGLSLGGEKRRVTMLAAELRGFTELAERVPPEVVVRLLNRYFEAMFDVATSHGGTISDIGSAGFVVLFGAPLAQEHTARRALECAVAMRSRLDGVNELSGQDGLPRVEMGIGVHTGEAVIGNVGSAQRAKYGAVGSAMNLAARIEGYATGGQILASDALLTDAGSGVRVDGTMQIRPKGIDEAVVVHDIAGIESD